MDRYINFLCCNFNCSDLGYKEVTSKNINIKYEEISKYLVIAIFIMFVVFTFFPPRIDIFKDEVTSTYGVFEFK